MGVPSDDQRANLQPAIAQQPLSSQQAVLPLPGLQAPDQADDGPSLPGDSGCAGLRTRRDVRTGSHDECPTVWPQAFLGPRGGVGGAADRFGREQRRATVQPVPGGDFMLPPDDPAAHPGEHGRGGAVEVRLAHPVDDQLRAPASQKAGHGEDAAEHPEGLTQPAGLDHLDVQSRRTELGRPGAVLQEEELELDAPVHPRRRAKSGASPPRRPAARPRAPL